MLYTYLHFCFKRSRKPAKIQSHIRVCGKVILLFLNKIYKDLIKIAPKKYKNRSKNDKKKPKKIQKYP